MDAAAYLSRIGAFPDDPLDVLMRRHLEAVPFENLSVHRQETITLESSALVEKIVDRRRGGFCYELNGAFAWLLGELGYDVTLCSARVHTGTGFTAPGDHLTLIVGRAVVDVGFGHFALAPVDLDTPPDGRPGAYRVRPAPDGELDVVIEKTPVYRVDPRARTLADFVPSAWYHATSPASHFTQSLTCSRRTPTGRITLAGPTLTTTEDGGDRTETTLTDAEQLAAYRDAFGIVLDEVPPVLHPRPDDA